LRRFEENIGENREKVGDLRRIEETFEI